MKNKKEDEFKFTADFLEALVKKSIQECIEPEQKLDENYVSQPKNYKQVTEFLSEKSKRAHKELYEQYVDTLNKISVDLDTVKRGTEYVNSRHSAFRSLKLDETHNLNAKLLHELFFENAFDPNSVLHMDELSYLRLQRDWGSFEDWQRDFTACALTCGNGWAVCGYNIHLKRYVNTIVSDHSSDVMIGLFPVIVLDCFEHAYERDYLNDKASYINAMLKEINWSVVQKRVDQAEKIAMATK
jgi:Fe-Mn family superoxide dismutase